MIPLNSFPGHDWQDLDCEEMIARHIPLSLMKGESELFGTKHWDYRFMHPAKATQLFAQHYAIAKKRALQRRVDVYIGHNHRPLKAASVFDLAKSHVTGFWKARRQADQLGIPYDFYCEQAMQFADVARWQNLPGPIQLYSSKVPEHLQTTDYAVSMVEFIGQRWLERCKTSFPYATHEAYLVEHYANGSEQNKYLNALFALIDSAQRKDAVAAMLIEKGQLSRALIEKVYPRSGKALADRAERFLA